MIVVMLIIESPNTEIKEYKNKIYIDDIIILQENNKTYLGMPTIIEKKLMHGKRKVVVNKHYEKPIIKYCIPDKELRLIHNQALAMFMENNAYIREHFLNKYIKIHVSDDINKEHLKKQVMYAVDSAKEKMTRIVAENKDQICLN